MDNIQNILEKDLKFQNVVDLAKLDEKVDSSLEFSKKFSVVVPALNEEHTINKLILDIKSSLNKLYSLNDFEIIIIDDGSKDLTFENASQEPVARVFKNKVNMGKGYSMRKGLDLARGKYVAFIDADGSHHVSDLIRGFKIIEKLEASDLQDRPFLITGVRFRNANHGTTVLNKIGNKLYSMIGVALWGQNINDLTCGLRFIKKSDFVNLDLTASRYTIEVEMLGLSLRKKYKIIQLPINATQRVYGSSGVRAMKEGIIIPVSFVLASLNFFRYIANKLSI